ncbi:MAG: hypothetical protein KME56_17340 [Candidatus Thiodiazotropha sp. (ex Ctena orbiculata)]|nr:hypothetical protein [Candidatus Thiodiazotropha taylori]MBT2998382.1 hypothetical protein [Candidatus Thiodiazotropha taylori]MBT3000327.1 hypothetical protein [Candidatus Thiodiazotropha taylori]MBT3027331.1 hypothetical protein [Candidatus Thiodiazotropha taylori]MBT3035206.1 hypothetical protein [Candidatus Thiodiazotropha taylori]
MQEIDDKKKDRISAGIACLDQQKLRPTLVSTIGSHCEVWRSNKRHEIETENEDEVVYTEFVIKRPFSEHTISEAILLARHYRQLKETLDEIIPDALFVVSNINGKPSLFVLARAVNIWFNIANQQNEEEAMKLLCAYPKARIQLARFVKAAQAWRTSDNPKMIDLFGIDNLIMDTNREIRFLDSFFVFFFEDTFHVIDGSEEDSELKDKVELSVKRLHYLEHLLFMAKEICDQQQQSG